MNLPIVLWHRNKNDVRVKNINGDIEVYIGGKCVFMTKKVNEACGLRASLSIIDENVSEDLVRDVIMPSTRQKVRGEKMFEADKMEGCHSCKYGDEFDTEKEPCKYCYGLSKYTKKEVEDGNDNNKV